MRTFISIVAVAMLGLALGCDKKEQTKNPAAPAGATTRPGSGSTGAARPQAAPTVTPTPTPAPTPAPAPAKTETNTPTPAPAQPAVDPAKAAADAKAKATAEAQGKLTQVMDYIKSNKLDLADSTLKQLEAAKDSLPAELQSKISTARQALDAARKSPVKLPGGLGM